MAMNSVNPPVRSWIPASSRRCATWCAGVSTCPKTMVAVEGSPARCAASITSTHARDRKVRTARQASPHVVVEDARGGAGNRAESRLPRGEEELLQRHPAAGRPVEQFRRSERVQVDPRRGRLDGGDEIQVIVIGVGRQRSLHADLGGTELTCLGHQRGQPLP